MKTMFLNKQITLSIIVLLFVSIVLFLHFRIGEEETVIELFQQDIDSVKEQENEEVGEEAMIIIDIKGAIARPGVYELKMGDRVYHAIDLAGGILIEADEQQLNLAQLLHDEMVIYVPVLEEEGDRFWGTHGFANNQDGKVAINRVDAIALEQLPGIGPAKASAIISYRDEHGPFKDISDLLNVSGIGPKSIEKLGEHLTFN